MSHYSDWRSELGERSGPLEGDKEARDSLSKSQTCRKSGESLHKAFPRSTNAVPAFHCLDQLLQLHVSQILSAEILGAYDFMPV